MKKLTLRSKTAISISLFVAIFAVLIGVASVFDLQISDIMTKGALPAGEYYATDFFGVLGEIVGTSPLYLVASFCAVILFHYFRRCTKVYHNKAVNYTVAAGCAVVIFALMFVMFMDINTYVLRHFGDPTVLVKDVIKTPSLVALEVIFALVAMVLIIFSTQNMKDDTVHKLVKFAFIALIGIIVANLIVLLVKSPVGRMRYRAMNQIGDFGAYTPWYIANGKPSEADIKLFVDGSDAFKSFPSGHTCSAGSIYALMLLPSFLTFKKKGTKYIFYIVPAVVTGLVAASRIMVGAHFMSDVTFGGTIAFLSMMLVREIFVCKFSHFKALFSHGANLALQTADNDAATFYECETRAAEANAEATTAANAEANAEATTAANAEPNAEANTEKCADCAKSEII